MHNRSQHPVISLSHGRPIMHYLHLPPLVILVRVGTWPRKTASPVAAQSREQYGQQEVAVTQSHHSWQAWLNRVGTIQACAQANSSIAPLLHNGIPLFHQARLPFDRVSSPIRSQQDGAHLIDAAAVEIREAVRLLQGRRRPPTARMPHRGMQRGVAPVAAAGLVRASVRRRLLLCL